MRDGVGTRSNSAAHAPPLATGELIASSHREGHVHTLCLSGELDLATADRVHAELTRIEATKPRSIVIDLAGLTFMDSTGIQLLVRAQQRSHAGAHRLIIRPGPAAVHRVFTLCGVDELLPFADKTE